MMSCEYSAAVNARDATQIVAAAAKCGPLQDQSEDVFALQEAVRSDRWDLVDAFLRTGTSLDITTHDDRSTPLMWAAGQGQASMVRNLLRNGADLEKMDRLGRTAIFYAAAGQHAEVVGLLLESGANVKHRDLNGDSAADLARYRTFRWKFPGVQVGGKYRTLFDTDVRRILRNAMREP